MSKSVALVLSSGGARGMAHIGVIEGLLEEGYEITSVSGCSMGAVVGAVYAAGKMPEFKEWMCNLDKMDVFRLLDFTLSMQGFIRGERVFEEMKKFLKDRKIEELNIPFAANAVDVVSGKEVVFKTGSVYEAIRASSAIPSVLKPSLVDGKELVDGGVLNPLPVNHVTRQANDLLVMSDVNAYIPYNPPKKSVKPTPEPPKKEKAFIDQFIEKWNDYMPKSETSALKSSKMGFIDLMSNSLYLMQNQMVNLTIERYPADILVRLSRHVSGTFDFYRSEELVEAGKVAFKEAHKKLLP